MNTLPQRLLLRSNLRFYILCFSLLLSIAGFAWLRLTVESDSLLTIRLQQLYGFICLIFWYIAMITSPLGAIIPKKRLRVLIFSRRAIGVSAFYFALLHSVIALWGQLGGIANLTYLPPLFQWSLLFGALGLLILAVMASTSLDRVIKFMTYRRWKWLHRLVYLAGLGVIIHVWSIGTHMAYPAVQIAGFALLMLLLGLEIYRIALSLNIRRYLSKLETSVTLIMAWALVAVMIGALPAMVQNYHSRHNHDSGEQKRGGHGH